ncbi:MAG: hypothetical protein ACOX0K_01585 [Oscillospiraceae bacterium]|jgi:hypothetical protein
MEKQKQKKNNKDSLAHLDIDVVSAASSMDCTGLIPAAPKNEFEEEAYKSLYHFEANINQ